MSRQPIGIFDSGIGGLTVFREIAKLLPHEDLIYLGDTARVPYGTKSPSTVTRYALQNTRFLLSEGVKLVVVACNTASAFALTEIQGQFAIPILGVIEPGVTGALRSVSDNPSPHVCVIGTEGTIASGVYTQSLVKQNSAVRAAGVACPLFVPLVEEGWWNHEVTEQVARTYLDTILKGPLDALILGCTHYPLLKETLRKVVGPRTALVDSAEETARVVGRLLKEKDLLAPARTASHKFCVTDSPERFRRIGSMIVGQAIENVHHVEI